MDETTPLERVERAVWARAQAQDELAAALRRLDGPERRDGLRLANEAKVGATELSRMLGISRQRIYELLED